MLHDRNITIQIGGLGVVLILMLTIALVVAASKLGRDYEKEVCVDVASRVSVDEASRAFDACVASFEEDG